MLFCALFFANISLLYKISFTTGGVSMRDTVSASKNAKLKNALVAFFMGPIYPVLICLMVLIGHICAIEFYLNIVIVLSGCLAFLVCSSLRPIIIILCTYTYQISVKNAPGVPSWSDYYFTEGRGAVVLTLFVLAGICLFVYLFKNRLLTKESLFSLPMKLSFPLFAITFLLNGLGSEEWTVSSLVYGAMQIVCLYLVVYIFYLGLKDEDFNELVSYFAYLAALMVLVLVGEMINAFLVNGNGIVDGSINRHIFRLGWGNGNVLGINLVALIPLLFYGVMKSRWSVAYFLVAVVDYVAALVTLSRNAALFGGIMFTLCLIICCYCKEKKVLCRVMSIILVICAVGVGVICYDEILKLLQRYVTSGTSDSGRYNLWRFGYEKFLESPMFGKGFFGLNTSLALDAYFLPEMVHNTVFQLLGATGAVGTAAYGLYRLQTLEPFFRKPTIEKTMLGLSALLLVVESLLDNFIFYFQPTFPYAVALAIAFLIYKKQEE